VYIEVCRQNVFLVVLSSSCFIVAEGNHGSAGIQSGAPVQHSGIGIYMSAGSGQLYGTTPNTQSVDSLSKHRNTVIETDKRHEKQKKALTKGRRLAYCPHWFQAFWRQMAGKQPFLPTASELEALSPTEKSSRSFIFWDLFCRALFWNVMFIELTIFSVDKSRVPNAKYAPMHDANPSEEQAVADGILATSISSRFPEHAHKHCHREGQAT